MRATLPLLLSASLFALSGCIIYDHDCVGCEDDLERDHERRGDDCDTGGGCGDGTSDTADTGYYEELDYGLTLTPDEAEQGETFIAALRAEEDDAPGYEEITGVVFYGSVEVITEDVRSYEYLLTLSVSEDAETGGVDLVVEYEDGSAAWVEDALTIYEAGSGHEAGGSEDETYDPCE